MDWTDAFLVVLVVAGVAAWATIITTTAGL
jgi:hypothetical protein